jgi:hypothetical protein
MHEMAAKTSRAAADACCSQVLTAPLHIIVKSLYAAPAARLPMVTLTGTTAEPVRCAHVARQNNHNGPATSCSESQSSEKPMKQKLA